MSYDLVTGDTGSVLQVTVKDKAGAPVDLTGASVKYRWEGTSGIVEASATITNAATGVTQYQFTTGQIIAPTMKIEVEVTDAAGKKTTCVDLVQLSVREELG